jgi:hypothetical protein
MTMRGAWVYRALLANGALVALLGAGYLFVDFVFPQIVLTVEHLQGAAIYDPAVGGDPMTARPHDGLRVGVAALFLIAGTAHAVAGALGLRARRSVLVALTILGMASFVPTSILLGIVALGVSLRNTEPGT